jgi:hypothetical protein
MTTKNTSSMTDILTRQERQLAAGHWLLAAAPVAAQAQAEWQDAGAAWLQPGALFSAITVPARRVRAAAGVADAGQCAVVLAEALDGPVFCRTGVFGREPAYTVLLPASAARVWRVPGTVVHPPRAQLLVPAPGRCEPAGEGPWWVVPFDGPGLLCTPALLAAFLSRPSAPRDGEGGDA